MVEVVELPMSVAQVTIDASATYEMTRVVGVGNGKALQDSKLSFDQIEPRKLPSESKRGGCAGGATERENADDHERCASCPE